MAICVLATVHHESDGISDINHDPRRRCHDSQMAGTPEGGSESVEVGCTECRDDGWDDRDIGTEGLSEGIPWDRVEALSAQHTPSG